MKRTEYLSVPAGLVAAFILSTSLPALAQDAGIKSLDGKARTGGKILTKDELRACMKQQDELAKQRADIDARRTAMNQERDALQAENEALKVDQAALQERNGKIKEQNERTNALSARVEAYNKGMAELNEMRPGPFADRKRRELEREKQEIARLDTQGRSEGDSMRSALEKDAAALNTRIDTQNKRAAEWNTRSKALDEEASAYEDKRVDWKLYCGDRRYREDDEKAIKAGK